MSHGDQFSASEAADGSARIRLYVFRGLALARKSDLTSDVYRRADLALYGAKLAGRDRIHVDINGHSNMAIRG
ncbi:MULTISPECIES: hypothetical protein [unclassified Sinorhizobium]|uniref:hypothetical protein n=1 Tax=unclassified Sinorhizobium TaxID=2613772 RepID=UPI00352414B5